MGWSRECQKGGALFKANRLGSSASSVVRILLLPAPMSSSVDAESVCIICYASVPPPIQSGCACRSDSGLAHVDCLIEKAVSQQARRGTEAWRECQTCEQRFTGAMATGLGEAWWSRVCDQAEESQERLCAAHCLAECRRLDGQYAEAVQIQRKVLDVMRRVKGEEHPDTLSSAANLATALTHAGPGEVADAERINRLVHGLRRRVLGEEHPDTLAAAHNLATSLALQGKHSAAERMKREVLDVSRRVKGEEHPDTLSAAYGLAVTLALQAKYCEAEQILQATLQVRRRLLGNAHPHTLDTQQWIENVRALIRASQPTRPAGKAAARRNERVASPALSPAALAEAEARARVAEAELLAMLDLEEPGMEAGSGSGLASVACKAKGKTKGKAKGKASER